MIYLIRINKNMRRLLYGGLEIRGLRGSMLEEMVNITNNIYREKLALIQKVPTLLPL